MIKQGNFRGTQLSDLAVPDAWFNGAAIISDEPLQFVCHVLYNNSEADFVSVTVKTLDNPEALIIPIGPLHYIEGFFTHITRCDDDPELLRVSCHGRCGVRTPEIAVTAVTDTTVTIAWSYLPGATSIRIFQQLEGSDEWLDFTSVDGNAIESTITGLDRGTRYLFKITAYTASSQSTSNIVDALTTNVPDATVLSLGSVGDTTVALSWTPVSDNGSTITEFDIFSSTDNESFGLAASTTDYEYTVTGLDPETQYWFKVVVVNGVGNSADSNTVTATTTATP